MALVDDTGLRALSDYLCTKFELHRLFRSEDMTQHTFRLNINRPGDLDF